ncbi:tetratricopeptide repeat protein [Treponema lecithinolyticum]
MQTDPKNYRLYMDLADCYVKTNQKAKAVEILESFQKQGLRSQAVAEMLEKLL